MRANVWEDAQQLVEENPGLVNYNYVDDKQKITGKTPLFLAVELFMESACSVENVSYLLSKGADPNKWSTYEGSDHTPMFLCTTAPKRKYKEMLIVARMLVDHGLSVNNCDLLLETVERMIVNRNEDYDETMVDFICKNGASQEMLSQSLAKMVPLKFPWAEKITNCLLHRGASIYHTGENDSALSKAEFYNTASAKLVHKVDCGIVRAKTVKTFRHDIHKLAYFSTPVRQWRVFVPDYDEVVKRVGLDERNACLVLWHRDSAFSILPKEMLALIMPYVTSSVACRRLSEWRLAYA